MATLATIFIIFLAVAPLLAFSQASFPINIWPFPTTMKWSSEPRHFAAPLSSDFKIRYASSHHDNKYLIVAIKRYHRLLFGENYHPIVFPDVEIISNTTLTHLNLAVVDPASPLQHGVDESYRLNIYSDHANLTAVTAWGAIRGLESFSQLTWGSPPVIAVGVDIDDKPLYRYRGLVLDTSRNYYPVEDILRTISAMGANKLNVFHWHITDSQSFPVELPSVPELAKKGSYGASMQYSPDDVKKIVNFAASHGVRVVPEIDAPGHAGSWSEAYPDIVTCANKFWLPKGADDWADRLAAEPGTGQLNPLKSETYEVYSRVLHDIVNLFPDTFFHAGADEIAPGCWNDDETIQAFVEQQNGTLSDVLETFVNKTHPLIVSHNRTVVYWEDVLLDPIIKVRASSLPKETTILETWNNGPNNTKIITAAGYRVIVSSSDFYYLDCGHGDFTGNDSSYNNPGSDIGTIGESWCGPLKTWQRIYDYDITFNLTDDEAALVEGGEVALWSYQADAAVLDVP